MTYTKAQIERLYQLAANGDAKAESEYEKATAHYQPTPPIFVSGNEVANPPSWAKGHLVTDGKKTWLA